MNSNYKKLTDSDINYFKNILPEQGITRDAEKLMFYGKDYVGDNFFEPELILFPENAAQISKILKYCNENKIPVTPRGAGTSLSGGALPVFGGIILSLEKLNKIINIDKENLQAVVEPGVINQVLQDTVAESGLFYPPDPASRGSCFLGGNVSHSSGGPRAVKYGTTKDYVLNLEVVLPNGKIIWTGANTLKNSTGYNLTQLMVGSEGTLGVITKIVFKLIPLPKHNLLMLAAFDSAEKACEAVSAIFQAGIVPSALEFMERDAIDYTLKHTQASMQIPDWVKAHLLIEVDGNYQETLMQDCEIINTVLDAHGVGEVFFADSDYEKEKLWAIRRKVGEAVKSFSVYKEEDTVVPRAELPVLLKGVKEIGEKYGFRSVCYGHAGDGNLHVNILKENLTEEEWNHTINAGIREIFELCKKLGGTISGEHGIGYIQKEFLDIVFPEVQIEIMRSIKKIFDPNSILNPGKIF